MINLSLNPGVSLIIKIVNNRYRFHFPKALKKKKKKTIADSQIFCQRSSIPPEGKGSQPISFPSVVSLESRAMHLNTLVQEAQERMSELSAQVENEGFSLDNTEKEKQLKAWEWRFRLYRRMKTGFEHASEYKQRTCTFN